jgi:ribosomal protein S18 acetylase RimI-like enzyme
MKTGDFDTRQAEAADAGDIAEAHRDSIRSIGPRYYPPTVVDDWCAGLSGDVYVKAMQAGEVFFVAIGHIDGARAVLGFASDYRREGTEHGTSVYVRGTAARCGVGSALIRLAEAHAVAQGATSIHIEASLAGVDFYKAHGYREVARGETRLMTGRPIACVFMRKIVGPA